MMPLSLERVHCIHTCTHMWEREGFIRLYPLCRAYLIWLLVVYRRTPESSQPALFTRIFSCTVHRQCSLRLQMARAGERQRTIVWCVWGPYGGVQCALLCMHYSVRVCAHDYQTHHYTHVHLHTCTYTGLDSRLFHTHKKYNYAYVGHIVLHNSHAPLLPFLPRMATWLMSGDHITYLALATRTLFSILQVVNMQSSIWHKTLQSWLFTYNVYGTL